MQPAPSVANYVTVVEMILAQWNGATIGAAAKFGIADQLESGPKTTKELASSLTWAAPFVSTIGDSLSGFSAPAYSGGQLI